LSKDFFILRAGEMIFIFMFYMASDVIGLVLGMLPIPFFFYSPFFIIKIPTDLLSRGQPCSIVNNQKTGFIPSWPTVIFLASVLGWVLHPLKQRSIGSSLSLSTYID